MGADLFRIVRSHNQRTSGVPLSWPPRVGSPRRKARLRKTRVAAPVFPFARAAARDGTPGPADPSRKNSGHLHTCMSRREGTLGRASHPALPPEQTDRKSTRLNSNHVDISYAA